MLKVNIIGAEELYGKLASVKEETRRKGGRASLRKAANVFVQAIREGAMRLDDSATGRAIADNVEARWNPRLYKSSGDLGFRVGIAQGAVLPKAGEEPSLEAKAPTPHWRLLEFGTENMPARPFARPAIEQNLQAATDVFAVNYMSAIDRAIRRARKKGVSA